MGIVEPNTTVLCEPSRDARTAPYLILGGILAIGSLLTTNGFLAALAAALLVLCFVELRYTRALSVSVTPQLDAQRFIVGDEARASITVAHDPRVVLDAEMVKVDLVQDYGVPTLERVERSRGVTRFEFVRPLPEFGTFRFGRLALRASAPNSMVRWYGPAADLDLVRVLPKANQLDELLSPNASQATAGEHKARLVAFDGSDFVDLREYQPGDRLRDINWKVTARRGVPHINRRRAERGGDVIILIDALADNFAFRSTIGAAMLQRAGQATWALVKNHMAAQDRVGIMMRRGQHAVYLPPRGGTRAQYLLIDALLEANADQITMPVRPFDVRLVPPGTLTITVTPLLTPASLTAPVALASNGRASGVLVLSADALLSAHAAVQPGVARLASASLDANTAFLRRTGVPTVIWKPDHDLNRAVRRLASLTARATTRESAR